MHIEVSRQNKDQSDLSIDSILSLIGAYDIYRYYLGRDFKVNKATYSPFRKEQKPSFLIGTKLGRLYHFDFTETRYRGGPIDFVMQLYSFNLKEALLRISQDFGIGQAKQKRIVPVYDTPVIERKFTQIQVVIRPFTAEDLKYWKEYYQDLQDLDREGVYSVKKLFINKEQIWLKEGELVFGYLYDEYWKIYQPGSKKCKWLSNVPIDRVDGLPNIKACKKAVVTKSKKDLMVIRKIFPHVCAVQNESLVALNEETVSYLKANAEEVYINYDCDLPGKKSSWDVTKLFNFKHINVPDLYLEEGIKDFAMLAKVKGLEVVQEYFKSKNIF